MNSEEIAQQLLLAVQERRQDNHVTLADVLPYVAATIQAVYQTGRADASKDVAQALHRFGYKGAVIEAVTLAALGRKE